MAMPARVPADNIINGVNTDDLTSLVAAIEHEPRLASLVFRAKNRWIDGSHSRTVIQEFLVAGKEDATRIQPFVFDADEPIMLLGNDQGAAPGEFVLHALASCLTTTLVFNAAMRGIELDEVECTLEGDVDGRGVLGMSDEVRNGYQDIRVTFRIKADVPDETLDELCRLAQQRSPVFDIVTNPVPVEVRCERA